MSMRGSIIAEEYKSMVWVKDKNGKEYACYAKDLKNLKSGEGLTAEQREKCSDLSQIVGDSW